LENQNKDFKMGGFCGWSWRPEKTQEIELENVKKRELLEDL
jgi:hypothetical protein